MTIEQRITQAESHLHDVFTKIDQTETINTRRILEAFRTEQVSYRHFAPTTGYGYDDIGRDTLSRVFAKVFHTEAAIVRPQIASGTQDRKSVV